MTELIPVPPAWTPDDTENFLTKFPLPTDFRWDRVQRQADGTKKILPDQPVLPDYRISKGYGFWLRTTPYFPGLFEEIHDILARAPEEQPLSAEWVARQLQIRRAHSPQTTEELPLS